VDDLSRPKRIEAQLLAAAARPGALVGARVSREPEGSTARYVAWANEMSEEELLLHRFRECTLLMPTWFMARGTFVRGGGFREEKCEDLLFLHAHVARGGSLHRVGGSPLVVYRYHAAAVTHATPRALLLRHRTAALEAAVLSAHPSWARFTIWGAGRDGRDFFKAMSEDGKRRVAAFCDVDPKKIGSKYIYEAHRVPIVHFREAQPPFVLCVALGRTGGAFEANVTSLGLREGLDYYHFC